MAYQTALEIHNAHMRLRNALVSFLLLVTATLPLAPWLPGYWHNQQRIGQILVFCLCVLAGILSLRSQRSSAPLLGTGPHNCLAAVLLAGLTSALLAQHTGWALAELGLAILSLALGGTVAASRRRVGPVLDQALLGTLTLMISCFLALYFFLYYWQVTQTGALNAYKLLWGFSNPRFLAQFLALALPVIVWPLLRDETSRREKLLVSVIAALGWTLAITSAARGLALGMAVAMVWLSLSGSVGRRWSLLQLRSAALGLLIYLLMLSAIPAWLGIEVTEHAANRLHTSLSSRDILWPLALEMIQQKPWLGFGPMHFSAHFNVVAAHPHQAILQIASEWGIPVAIIVIGLVFLAARATFRMLRKTADSRDPTDTLRVCLAGGITTALTLAMVDGILVMPHVELWLAIIAGWLLGLHPATTAPATRSLILRRGWLLTQTLAAVFLAGIVFRDLPALAMQTEEYSQTFKSHLQPRFWQQGVIDDLDGALKIQQEHRQRNQ
ncbi:O-antigen ligase family protein [Azotobacter chroococcum]|uniref:O-antigen ligase family protein n=1 Tax=Azotobacter chroococcum TaxID=353 RepID=UPI0013968889|nr:O-antigen ligase family protein [Azotobacter chroococcum]